MTAAAGLKADFGVEFPFGYTGVVPDTPCVLPDKLTAIASASSSSSLASSTPTPGSSKCGLVSSSPQPYSSSAAVESGSVCLSNESDLALVATALYSPVPLLLTLEPLTTFATALSLALHTKWTLH